MNLRCAPTEGTAVGRQFASRYYCATSRNAHSCDQPLIHADRVEEQLVEFIADFKPHPAIRNEILRRLNSINHADTTETRAGATGIEPSFVASQIAIRPL